MIHPHHSPRRPSLWPAILTALPPAALFYLLLWRSALDLPISDDYDALLAFTNGFAALHGVGQRLLYILTFQHNEYKLIFEEFLFAAQYSLLGHLNIAALILLGNGFVFLLFLVLICMYRLPAENVVDRILLLLPISFLLFQLQYASTLNWSMGALQNLPVLVFSLSAIVLLSCETSLTFAAGCAAMLLAIASSGNGFMVALVGLLMLIQQKRHKLLGVWALALVAAATGYFYHYNFSSSQVPPGKIVINPFALLKPLYFFSFLGSSLAGLESWWSSLCFGLVLCAIFLLAVKKRYYLQNAAVFYSMLFLIITAITVAGMRSNFGLSQSLASRYRTYSNIFMILAYMFLMESYWGKRLKDRSQRTALATWIVLCCIFCGVSDHAGFRFLRDRRQAVMDEMAEWQHPHVDHVKDILRNNNNPILLRHIQAGLYKPNAAVLVESARLGIYRAPAEP